MAVKEVKGEREGKHTEMQTHIFTHSLAPAHTHAHTHTLLYQQNESAFWQYLNETEKSPIQPLCLAFINTARHWGDISLPSLAPSLLQTDTLTHTDMRTHTHINRGRSPVQVWWCLLLAFPPQSLFFLLAPPHLWAFVTSPPPPTTVLFHHTSLPPLSLSLSLLSLRLFASAAEWKYAQMRKGAVKLHISTGGSGSITDPISLRTRGREQGTTILLDNSSGPRREAQARPRSPPVWSRTLFARITAQKTPQQQQQPERTQGTRVLSQKKNLQGPGSDARMLASSSSSTPPPSPFSSSSSSLKLLLLVCGDPEIAAACLEVVWESVWDVGFICGSYVFS